MARKTYKKKTYKRKTYKKKIYKRKTGGMLGRLASAFSRSVGRSAESAPVREAATRLGQTIRQNKDNLGNSRISNTSGTTGVEIGKYTTTEATARSISNGNSSNYQSKPDISVDSSVGDTSSGDGWAGCGGFS
jgi:hypothetical protein